MSMKKAQIDYRLPRFRRLPCEYRTDTISIWANCEIRGVM